jgi:hypothetical protein
VRAATRAISTEILRENFCHAGWGVCDGSLTGAARLVTGSPEMAEYVLRSLGGGRTQYLRSPSLGCRLALTQS